MKNHKKFFGATIVFSLFLLTGGYAFTQAAEAKTPRPPIEEIKAAREAVIAGDYEAWAEVANQLPNADEVVNEDVFATLVEAYQLREAGEYKEARKLIKQLAEEYNLPVPPFYGWRMNAQSK